jgi:hypothetical protein
MLTTRIADIEEWLVRLQTLIERGSCPSPVFLKPFHFTTLAIQIKRFQMRQIVMPESLKAYAARMNLWEALDLNPPLKVRKRNESGKFLPLAAIRTQGEVHENAVKITKIAEAQYSGIQTLTSLEELLGEILDNSFSHAQIDAHLPSFACAQTWPQGNLAQVAIGDGGIGIRKSLLENPALIERLSGENACQIATERYLTSKPSVHSGYGLALARELIEQNSGNLLIVSGNDAFRNSRRTVSLATMGVAWQGTLVVIEWNTNRVLDTQAVYENWAQDTKGALHAD